MFLAMFMSIDEIYHVKLYDSEHKWQADKHIWKKPNYVSWKTLHIISFRVPGRTYAARKASLRQLAINYQNANTDGLSWEECTKISDFFAKNAKRYGLTEEFRENGII